MNSYSITYRTICGRTRTITVEAITPEKAEEELINCEKVISCKKVRSSPVQELERSPVDMDRLTGE